MSIFETYERRRLIAQRAGQADIFIYDKIPSFLRKQLKIVFADAIGVYDTSGYGRQNANSWWNMIVEVLEKEIESFPGDDYHKSSYTRCMQYLLEEENVDRWLSFVELGCRVLGVVKDSEDYETKGRGATQTGQSGIEEINLRFKQHGLGYEYTAGEIVRIDSQFVHSEVVKPVLTLLAVKGYEKVNDDFRIAHKHYRAGEWKDAIVSANRAFESCLKAICHENSWEYDKSARASDLVKVVIRNNLLPNYLDAGLTSYIAMLKTGLPGIRNEAGGHGEAPNDIPVSEYLARYAINLTASNILLLASAQKNRKKPKTKPTPK